MAIKLQGFDTILTFGCSLNMRKSQEMLGIPQTVAKFVPFIRCPVKQSGAGANIHLDQEVFFDMVMAMLVPDLPHTFLPELQGAVGKWQVSSN